MTVDQAELVAQALTSRLVPSSEKPLTSREFWPLTRITPLDSLPGRPASELAADLTVSHEQADRICRLLERTTALALATEALEQRGIWVTTAFSEHYPRRLEARLRDAAPPLLYGAGDRSLLGIDGLGVVGSRDIPPEAGEVAWKVAALAADAAVPLVSGAARGVDQQAMNAAFERGGAVVGVLADSLERAVGRPSTRKGIASGQICLATPYAPAAGFSAGNAMGRNKVIYALSRAVVVVRADDRAGGTWAGATEALAQDYARVLSWTGPGSGDGNRALVERGAIELRDDGDLTTRVLSAEPVAARTSAPAGDQMPLF